ncbi:nucleoside diphosphate kinase homolog 7 isoform X1 [Clinocottus analis]|uniref:nucleoside diphosphate kinase homolog 7 isoform X1 n=1 Tax=Clinocottus analis TaxID=304258 RepID=UPI0035BFBBE0
MEDRYAFLTEWLDPTAALLRRYQLFFYPKDSSVEMYDVKNQRVFLRRTRYEQLQPEDLFLGNRVTVFSRQLHLLEYGDQYTAKHLGSRKESPVVDPSLLVSCDLQNSGSDQTRRGEPAGRRAGADLLVQPAGDQSQDDHAVLDAGRRLLRRASLQTFLQFPSAVLELGPRGGPGADGRRGGVRLEAAAGPGGLLHGEEGGAAEHPRSAGNRQREERRSQLRLPRRRRPRAGVLLPVRRRPRPVQHGRVLQLHVLHHQAPRRGPRSDREDPELHLRGRIPDVSAPDVQRGPGQRRGVLRGVQRRGPGVPGHGGGAVLRALHGAGDPRSRRRSGLQGVLWAGRPGDQSTPASVLSAGAVRQRHGEERRPLHRPAGGRPAGGAVLLQASGRMTTQEAARET